MKKLYERSHTVNARTLQLEEENRQLKEALADAEENARDWKDAHRAVVDQMEALYQQPTTELVYRDNRINAMVNERLLHLLEKNHSLRLASALREAEAFLSPAVKPPATHINTRDKILPVIRRALGKYDSRRKLMAQQPEATGASDATFVEWLATEMPAGTVIHDPAWWADRIARQYAVRCAQHEPNATLALPCATTTRRGSDG